MFSKKYVFETKSTRAKRVIRNIILIFISSLTAFSLLCIYLPIFAKKQNELTSESLFLKAPDLIAVYTGDAGRIDYALKLAEKYPSAKLFISGVDARNSLKTLLHKQGKGISVEQFLDNESHHIELDYLSRNTVENGLSTLHYLKDNRQLKSVLIISSDYHILRISLILSTLSDVDDISFYFESIETNYSQVKNLVKLFKEVYKLLRTSTFLLFWD